MKKYFTIFVLIQIFSIYVVTKLFFPSPTDYGIDIFFKKHLNLIKDKNIGLLAIKSSSNKNGEHIVDLLLDFNIHKSLKIFAPEHGFYSNYANGEKIDDEKYKNIDVVSLYGSKRKPSENDISNIDVILIDIQDIGSSYYTYLSTVTYMMEIASEHNISVIVLDRPNPLGMLVYGPIREKFGFIGLHPIPIRHGMTLGELCLMINEMKWLKDQKKVKDLEIIKMKKIPKKSQFYNWIPPSPNIPNKETAFAYNGMCLFEGTNISEGRGTNNPFRMIGAPWIDLDKLMVYIENLKKTKYGNKVIVNGLQFKPLSNKGAKTPKYENQICNGIFIEYIDESIEPLEFAIDLLVHFNDYEQFNFNDSFFDTLYGSSDLRLAISKNNDINNVLYKIDNDVVKFKEQRKNFLIYKQKHKQ